MVNVLRILTTFITKYGLPWKKMLRSKILGRGKCMFELLNENKATDCFYIMSLHPIYNIHRSNEY